MLYEAILTILIAAIILLTIVMVWSFFRQFSFDDGFFRLLIAVIVSIILLAILYIYFSRYVPFYLYPLIFVYASAATAFLLYGKVPANATLTCENGHTHRAWINYRPVGFGRNYGKGGIVINVDGKPIVRPECCPECGARWVVPRKRMKPNMSDNNENLD